MITALVEEGFVLMEAFGEPLDYSSEEHRSRMYVLKHKQPAAAVACDFQAGSDRFLLAFLGLLTSLGCRLTASVTLSRALSVMRWQRRGLW